MAKRLVIIGGDATGMSAATQALRMKTVAEFKIVAIERSSRTSYAACGDAAFGGMLGTAITRSKEMEIAHTGLTEQEAKAAGLDAIGVITEASSRAHYDPGAEPMNIKMVVERGTGRPLGARIVGGTGAGKRIDVLATALWNGMTVAEVAGMDLSYAPPFSPVSDPVLLAAGKAASVV